MSNATPMSEPSLTKEQNNLKFFQEDFLASLSAEPASVEAVKMTVTSGRQCWRLSKDSGPLGLLVKMCLESLTWNSTDVFLIWRAVGTPRGRLLFQLLPWTPNNHDRASGLWPTMKHGDYR